MAYVFICERYKARMQRRAKRTERLKIAAGAIGLMLVLTATMPIITEKMEQENQWRAERLCSVYSVCPAQAGE